MKLNYREKIILGCFLAVAILLGAFLGLVKPKTKTLKDNQARLEELEAEKAEIDAKILQIKPLQDKIKEIYQETNQIASIFVPKEEIDTPVKIDKMLQKYADENDVKVTSLEVSKPTVASLDYYYYQDDDYAESYREEVDLGGQLQAQYDAEHAEQKHLEEREVENLFETKYGVVVNGTKENIFKYLEAIKQYDKAMVIKSVQIYDYSFGENALREAMKAGAQIAETVAPPTEEAAPAEGEEAEAQEQGGETTEEAAPQETAPTSVTVDGKEITNTSDVQIVISVYSVFTMPEPNVDYVPSATE
jgi:hypothetical protein